MIAWLFGCRHRGDKYFDRVNGVAVWRCPRCMMVIERGRTPTAQTDPVVGTVGTSVPLTTPSLFLRSEHLS